ncbi:MAG TPA: phosphotransferase [Acidimicrobiales bacterium]
MGDAPGPLLASGRDSEIFDVGGGRVLRRPRSGRSLAGEATVMAAVHATGYPVPRVDEVLPDGSLVMERVEGPTMLDDLARRPWRARRHARTLASLLGRLHDVAAPEGMALAPAGVPGDAIVHMDLHPANVLMSPAGPVVVDWANAGRGAPAADVAMTWLLCRAAQAPVEGAARVVVAAFQARFAELVVAGLDRRAAMAVVPAVVEWKAKDGNLHPGEVEAMRRLARRGR